MTTREDVRSFLDRLDLTETELLIGARIVKEIRQRLTFLDDVGVGYLAWRTCSCNASASTATPSPPC